jgi:hypothetical protein
MRPRCMHGLWLCGLGALVLCRAPPVAPRARRMALPTGRRPHSCRGPRRCALPSALFVCPGSLRRSAWALLYAFWLCFRQHEQRHAQERLGRGGQSKRPLLTTAAAMWRARADVLASRRLRSAPVEISITCSRALDGLTCHTWASSLCMP